MAKRYRRKKIKKNVTRGIVCIKATFNNTNITITDIYGNVVAWATAGGAGFKGTRKSTPFAAQKTAEIAAEKATKMGMREVEVKVKGPGAGRESSIRGIQGAGMVIKAITDVTPLPHNGCRPRTKAEAK
ncbi:MAG: 30S ribosomal protein S11 [Planctomycetota bacterium]|jgi:small subunit ribosomal protein S11